MALALMILNLNRILSPYLKEQIKNSLRSIEDYKKKKKTWNFPYNQKNHRVICFLIWCLNTNYDHFGEQFKLH